MDSRCQISLAIIFRTFGSRSDTHIHGSVFKCQLSGEAMLLVSFFLCAEAFAIYVSGFARHPIIYIISLPFVSVVCVRMLFHMSCQAFVH